MRAVIQRAREGKVVVEGKTVGEIGKGLVVLLGIIDEDNEKDIKWMVEKVVNLRIFEDDEGKLNRSLKDIGGELLVISQFTLYGDASKGRRPSFTRAAKGEVAEPIYNKFVEMARSQEIKVEEGIFGADMKVSLTNDGPVTIVVDSPIRK